MNRSTASRAQGTSIYGKLKTYLVGAMETTAEKDCGKGWRDMVRPSLERRNVHVFDPTVEEASKVGMPTEEFHKKLAGWKQGGCWELYQQQMDKIWRGVTYLDEKNRTNHIMGDVDYVIHSDFITARINPGDKPCGTYVEIGLAWYFGIPTYIITDMGKSELNGSLIYFVLSNGGDIFKSYKDYLTHIDQKYNLKEIKEC